MVHLLEFPDILLEEILKHLSYDKIATHRLVCCRFNEIGKRLLNCGFRSVERYHAKCLKEVKSELPRRESERRDHCLSHHCNILSGIETRLSLLNMTFLKYIEADMCCFIPGKVIDEIYRVLHFIYETKDKFLRDTLSPEVRDKLLKAMKANVILRELRDISSMAMEHFEEQILPDLNVNKPPRTRPTGEMGGVIGEQLNSLHVATKQNKNSNMSLKKTLNTVQNKCNECSRKLNEQEQALFETNHIISEQNAKLANQETKLAESNQKVIEINQKLDENEQKMSSLLRILNEHGIVLGETLSKDSSPKGILVSSSAMIKTSPSIGETKGHSGVSTPHHSKNLPFGSRSEINPCKLPFSSNLEKKSSNSADSANSGTRRATRKRGTISPSPEESIRPKIQKA